jgi:hypothetical protein
MRRGGPDGSSPGPSPAHTRGWPDRRAPRLSRARYRHARSSWAAVTGPGCSAASRRCGEPWRSCRSGSAWRPCRWRRPGCAARHLSVPGRRPAWSGSPPLRSPAPAPGPRDDGACQRRPGPWPHDPVTDQAIDLLEGDHAVVGRGAEDAVDGTHVIARVARRRCRETTAAPREPIRSVGWAVAARVLVCATATAGPAGSPPTQPPAT